MADGPWKLAEMEAGSVWLVGAGPGDPGLITLLAKSGIEQADVIVYDALVDEAVLALARPDCRLEFAGKRGGKPSHKQADISLRLISLARDGLKVLRLKGGDPFIFGRGGEEALALVEAGIPFRIVPGISSGVGGLAYAGIPLTHRTVNSAVTFVTGHDMTGHVPGGLDWQALAKGSPVLVLFMALKHLPDISAQLLAAGRDPTEAVAIVSRASLPDQRVLVTNLAHCAAEAAETGIKPPALVVVGEVVRLRESLQWLPCDDIREAEALPEVP